MLISKPETRGAPWMLLKNERVLIQCPNHNPTPFSALFINASQPYHRDPVEKTCIHMSEFTIATCTEHHEERTGRIYSSPAGLSSPVAGLTSVCTHPLTHPRESDGNITISNKRRDLPCLYEIQVGALLESESARRLLPPESVSIGSRSAGAASAHTHTVSICNSIAPHGRARPRAVTQMALGDLQMTYLPNSVSSPQGLVQFTRYYHRNIHPTAGDE